MSAREDEGVARDRLGRNGRGDPARRGSRVASSVIGRGGHRLRGKPFPLLMIPKALPLAFLPLMRHYCF
jgi:hypothetical protein